MTPLYRPKALASHGTDQVKITWNDDRIGYIPWSKLRSNCPCAMCNEDRHRITAPLAKPTSVGLSLTVLKEAPQSDIKPQALTPLGNYAYKIVWSDGHDTGIYTFEFLHSLCDWESKS
jgi:DUF971 family protein